MQICQKWHTLQVLQQLHTVQVFKKWHTLQVFQKIALLTSLSKVAHLASFALQNLQLCALAAASAYAQLYVIKSKVVIMMITLVMVCHHQNHH